MRRLGLRPWRRYWQWISETTQACRPQGRCLRLISFGVEPRHGQQGIGEQLLEAFCESAASRNLPYVQLECRADNPARRLYERLGFEIERTFETSHVQWLVMIHSVGRPKNEATGSPAAE